jgi:maltooligosyltrehalose trehalohydrolase
MLDNEMEFGVRLLPGGRSRFSAWAPGKSQLSVVLLGNERKIVNMTTRPCGFHEVETDAGPGARYVFRMSDDQEFPDPASRFQPQGVHGPSEIVDTAAFAWTDGAFASRPPSQTIIYEMHTGTFTPEGTLAAAIPRLADLADLGITAVELMPVAQFPGSRNWGYDGVFPYAVQNSYGGPRELQRFVDAAHALGISVILDVVYNHLGPEGNYLGQFGPFFTNRYSTPWGEAINFDGAWSEPVRAFFIQNALYWLRDFHIDALRLDAVHGIFDFSARHFLAELKGKVADLAARTSRSLSVIAESDLNDSRLLRQPERGGYDLDAQWSDDFHHALHALLTGENKGYYGDFGSLEDLGISMRDGWRYSGQYSRFRKRRHGNSPAGISPERFVVFDQNHDQVGNRAFGERLSALADFDSLKLAAGVTLLSPFVPLLFMGEEYGETHPFQYFTSHGDAGLIEAVRGGRREEFRAFGWEQDIPDPQAPSTFARSVLDYESRNCEPHRGLRDFYRSLIALRKKFELGGKRPRVQWDAASGWLILFYDEPATLAILNFGQDSPCIPLPNGPAWQDVILSSTSPQSVVHSLGNVPGGAPQKMHVARRSVTVLTSKAG